jgi:hypothetical protein
MPPVRARDTRIVADRRAFRDLLIVLATEILRRERGAPPPTEDALVGTYLQRLPDDGSAELADGTTPTVECRIRTSQPIRTEMLLGAPAASQPSRSRLRCLSPASASFSGESALLNWPTEFLLCRGLRLNLRTESRVLRARVRRHRRSPGAEPTGVRDID